MQKKENSQDSEDLFTSMKIEKNVSRSINIHLKENRSPVSYEKERREEGKIQFTSVRLLDRIK